MIEKKNGQYLFKCQFAPQWNSSIQENWTETLEQWPGDQDQRTKDCNTSEGSVHAHLMRQRSDIKEMIMTKGARKGREEEETLRFL